jgi:uncharacterized Zn-finger protein
VSGVASLRSCNVSIRLTCTYAHELFPPKLLHPRSWLDIFESQSGELFSRVGAAAVMLSEKADAGYTGVVKMRGLPFHATVHDIEAFFGAYRVAPHGIFITTGADGRLTGACALRPCRGATRLCCWVVLWVGVRRGCRIDVTAESLGPGPSPVSCMQPTQHDTTYHPHVSQATPTWCSRARETRRRRCRP